PHSLPTTHDAGRGSPTAVAFGTRSNFPPRYRAALFILDWAYGRIIALDVIPRGASYVCRSHTFLRGRPLNVTDIAFGPDQAMYFITGGRGTQSALYRVSYNGGVGLPPDLNRQEMARAEYSKQARASRRSLEQFHGSDGRAPAAAVGSADPWIRHAALVAGSSDAGSSASVPSLTGFRSWPRHEKLSAVQDSAAAAALLAPLFPDGDRAVDRELSRRLAGSGEAALVPESLSKLAATDSQFERLHYLDILSRARTGWTPDGRRAFFAAIRHPEYFRGDRNMPAYLDGIRARAVATLTDEEREALGNLTEPAQNPIPLPPPRPLVQHWTTADLDMAPPPRYQHDRARGRTIFEQALCSRCHQVGALGTPVGPDLSAVASRFSRRDLIEAIVEPSKAMAEIFRPVIIEKKDGSIVAGRVVRDDFRKSSLSISSDPFAPTVLTVVSKADIAHSERSLVSPMPPGLLDQFSKDEVFQLLDFLQGVQR
ncbi:MAG: c-type cytochrome, partial [Verrucomicrobiales bacterium]